MSNDRTPSRYSWKSAGISAVITFVGGVILFLAIGSQLEDTAEHVVERGMAQAELNQDIQSMRGGLGEIDKKLSEFEALMRRQTSVDSETQQTIAQLESQADAHRDRSMQLDEALAAYQSTVAWQRSQLVMLLSRGQRIQAALTSLTVSAADWATMYQDLMTSDSGRRIAGNEQHLELLATIDAREHATTETVNTWTEEFDELYAPVIQAEASQGEVFVADEGFEPAIVNLEQRVREAAETIRRDTLLIEALKRETTDRKPSELTLKESLAQRELGAVRKDTIELANARADSRRAAVERLKAAQAANDEAATRVEEAELERQEAERRAIETGIRNETKRLDQEAQQAEQRRKLELDYARELPEIRRLLHPFISDGRVQPIPGGFQSGWRMEPMSLSAIASTGALRDTDDGLAELYRVGGHSLNARRGLGGFPSHNPINLARNPSVRKTVERARELLQKYGDLLVEKGVLSR